MAIFASQSKKVFMYPAVFKIKAKKDAEKFLHMVEDEDF